MWLEAPEDQYAHTYTSIQFLSAFTFGTITTVQSRERQIDGEGERERERERERCSLL